MGISVNVRVERRIASKRRCNEVHENTRSPMKVAIKYPIEIRRSQVVSI